MAGELVPESAGRGPGAPCVSHHTGSDTHLCRKTGVEIGRADRFLVLMTGRAIAWGWCEPAFNVVASEASSVTDGRGLERALLKPERIAQICGRLDQKLFG